MAALSLSGISKSFGNTPVLRDITLSIDEGDLFFILGASGCGKSTLLRIIAGLETPDSGSLVADGRDLVSVPAHQRGIGMVFQQYALWPHMTVMQNVSFGLEVQRVPTAERETRVREALELVRMDSFAARYPHEISGGQQQRVALARALAVRPGIILLDEPLSNLDARLREEIRHELKELHRSLNVTMIYVTHDQEDALSLASSIALLRSGNVEQVGTPEDLYEVPRSPFVAQFLGSTNLLRCSVRRQNPDGNSEVTLASGGTESFLARSGSHNGDAACLLCVRPEAITVGAPGEAKEPSVEGTVRFVEYKGAHLDIECELDSGERVLSRTRPMARRELMHPGVRVSLRWAPSSGVLVPEGLNGDR
jgi:ABC-type Fe3+/spermidine/putrescine transport system ATPase subunit